VRQLFTAYRVLALVVGILLTVLVFVAMPMKYLLAEGSSGQQFGETLTTAVGITHGWVYIGYVMVAFFLSRRAKWDTGFTALTLAAGLVPILIFWVETRVVKRVQREHPELAPAGA
jgi:integral membrane protein